MSEYERNFKLTILALFSFFLGCVIYFTQEAKEENISKKLVQKIKEEIRKEEKEEKVEVTQDTQEQVANQEQTEIQENPIKDITINPQTPLSYKTKAEVYENRKYYVMNSMFKDENYEPSEEVFGQIEDNKPWVSHKICKYKSTGQADVEGPSEETRFINNPSLLVALEYAFYGHSCEKYRKRFVRTQSPIGIEYDTKNNEIIVRYTYLPNCDSAGRVWYSFKGLNARDLGYKYAYLDLEKSTFKPHFQEKTNISNSVVEFQDFIHVGGSCGVPGGCNNASPNQPPLNFLYPCTGEDGVVVKNRTLYIKLWKEEPSSPQQEADITEKIVIRTLYVNPEEA